MTTNIFNMSDTWNNAGTVFSSILMNISNGAAGNPVFAAGSLAINIQKNGTTTFGVDVNGNITTALAPTFNGNATINEVVGGSALTLVGATQTVSNPVLNATQTWNAAGITFTAWKLNVTNTASATGSLLIDLQVGASSKFNVDKAGNIAASGYLQASGNAYLGGGLTNAAVFVNAVSNTVQQVASGVFGWVPNSSNPTGTIETYLSRDTAYIIAQRSGANAQTFRVYNTFTDASNYERGVLDWTTTSNVLTFGVQNAGTGSNRSIAFKGLDFVFGASVATNATDGFIYIPGGSGAPTGVPTGFAGTYPLFWDHTDKKLYIYDGSWLGGTAPGVWS